MTMHPAVSNGAYDVARVREDFPALAMQDVLGGRVAELCSIAEPADRQQDDPCLIAGARNVEHRGATGLANYLRGEIALL